MNFNCLIDELVWASVEEALPEIKCPVLFWNTGTADHRPGCYVGWWDNAEYDGNAGRWFDIYGNSIYGGVSHWTPFPSGPDCTSRIGFTIQSHWG